MGFCFIYEILSCEGKNATSEPFLTRIRIMKNNLSFSSLIQENRRWTAEGDSIWYYMESFKKVKGMVGISINVDTETFSTSEKRVSICVI